MKLYSSNSPAPQIRRGLLLFAFFVVLGCGSTSGLAQIKSAKRITSIQVGDTADGSRVTIFSDAALNDYEAFRRGDNFYVRIPQATLATTQPHYNANGFDDVAAHSNGDSVLISFKLQPGVTARVDQRSNRLDVFFFTANRARLAVTRTSPNQTTSNTIPGIVMLPNARSRQTRTGDAAGPMPPDSPGANRARQVTQEENTGSQTTTPQQNQTRFNSSVESTTRTNTRASLNRPEVRTDFVPRQDSLKPAAQMESPSTYTATVTSNTTPAASPSPFASRPAVTTESTNSSASWTKRGQSVRQWATANRVAASVGVFVLLSSVAFICVVLYRSRRKPAANKQGKVRGVQPNYEPDLEGQDRFENNAETDSNYALFDDRAADLTQKSTAQAGFAISPPTSGNGSHNWKSLVVDPGTVRSMRAPTGKLEAELPAHTSLPIFAMRNDETEREVFEL